MFLLIISCLYLLVSVNDICYRKIPDIFPIVLSSVGLGILVINDDWVKGFTTLGLAVCHLPRSSPALHGW